MPSYLLRQRTGPQGHPVEHNEDDQDSHVFVTEEAEDTVTDLHQTLSRASRPADHHHSAFADFEKYLRGDNEEGEPWPAPVPLSVCFKNITTYGAKAEATSVKTVWDAVWRTLTCQDIYEATLKRVISTKRGNDGQALIRDFSGVVRNGQMMLVLGNPGSGCSTFLRTISGEHSSYLGVDGSLDYSGLTLKEIQKHHRSSVAYIPEDDVHLPTMTVRQTLEFALESKTPRRLMHQVPRFMEEFGRIFGMDHVMDTLVGNEYIRGVSGGQRKRVSILESLATDSFVNCWDGSTRGLDAASALDYIRSLRIMTDTTDRATLVSLYQVSDAMYELMDKLLLIDEGRMLYQGPTSEAEEYFNALGYKRLPRQTMSDFLTSITAGNAENLHDDASVPRGAVNLEKAFRASQAFKNVQTEIRAYEEEMATDPASAEVSRTDSSCPSVSKEQVHQPKSRFVSSASPYNTSFFRQALLATKRQYWQLMGHKAPFITKASCIFVCAFLLGSMFYMMPTDTGGVYSRGGFSFYCSALVAWFQMAELETAFFDRTVVSRQRRYAMMRPSAVVAGKAILDIPLLLLQTFSFTIVAYFLAGMRVDAGAYFGFSFAIFLAALGFVAFYRVFGAISPRLEIALRYCGLLLLVAVAFGGYVRPVARLISEVPWVGWLAYVTPVLYAFEIIMAFEFHNREFPCAAKSVIPAGSSYGDADYQSCAYQSMEQGQLSLQGDEYLTQQFGFSYNNIGRNFGILILFTVGLLAINMWLVENVDWVENSGGGYEYAQKKGEATKSAKYKDDEEHAGSGETAVSSRSVADSHSSNEKTSSLPKSSAVFTWRDLNYTIEHEGGDKQLLNGVSGYCEPGKLTALVGASGAGKSTLMTVLTQQATGKLDGQMMVNNRPVGPSFGQSIGYCQQMDIHVETSTVREAFEFSALLRQSATTSKSDKLATVDEVLDILHMRDLQNVVIQSLSLEQKKRTTIGVELCAKPSLLLFLDEPTSGLDGQGAMNIVRLLRRLADSGQAIICTIHQASQEQFELFDRVFALNHGGRVYYFGETGPKGKAVLDYFEKQGVPLEDDKNIADLLIEVTSRSSDHSERDWCDVWNKSPEAADVLRKIEKYTSTSSQASTEESSIQDSNKVYASSTWSQTHYLSRRTMLQYWRTPDYVYSRLYCSFFHALLNGLMYLQLGTSVADMQYRIFACFLVLMIVPEFINACAVMLDLNRNIWLGREYPSRVYGWVAFTSAQVISEIPYALIGAVIFYVPFYFLIGLPLGAPAGYTFLMIMMFHLFSTSWGQWIAAMSSDAVMAASIMPFFLVMCEFFNGVLQPQSLMPAIWAYTIYYVGPFTYWITGIANMILTPISVKCLESELIRFEAPPNTTCGEYASDWLSGTTGYLSNPDATSSCGYCQYEGGRDYLSTFTVPFSNPWASLGIFAVFTFTNYLMVYALVYVKSVKKWLPW